MNQVSKAQFNNNLRETIFKAVEPLGGFRRFIQVGDVVFLKPNFNTADPYHF